MTSELDHGSDQIAPREYGDSAVVESPCMQCGATGTTRLLLTKIPHFRDVILMSFECDSCGHRDNELQDAAPLQDHGMKIVARMLTPECLKNQIVLSGHTSTRIDELDFEFQPLAQKGSVTTVEGYLLRVAASLDEHVRSIAEALMEDPDLSIQLTTGEVKQAGEYIHTLTSLRERLMNYTDGFEPFTLMLDDPSGNSYVEFSDAVDITTEKYTRTEEQLKTMGYAVKDDFKKELDLTAPLDEATDVGQEGLSIAADCPNCGCEGLNKICEVLVPGFGPCVIMAFTCDTCGAKSNEIKPGGGYKDRAKRWTLNVNHASDLNRDVIISETAAVRIPHLDLEMSPGTIGAVFTTVEGLLGKLVESLEKAYPFLLGDSAPEDHARLRETVGRLRELASGELPQPFALVVDDPADHSFVGARASHAGEDCDLTAESYERTASQNEELGLTDMKTENY